MLLHFWKRKSITGKHTQTDILRRKKWIEYSLCSLLQQNRYRKMLPINTYSVYDKLWLNLSSSLFTSLVALLSVCLHLIHAFHPLSLSFIFCPSLAFVYKQHQYLFWRLKYAVYYITIFCWFVGSHMLCLCVRVIYVFLAPAAKQYIQL